MASAALLQLRCAPLGRHSSGLIRRPGGCAMIRREHITAPELAFLLVVGVSIIAMITAELELAFRVFG